nr:hypothetical protein [Tanacetum cinerariifolium]
MKVDLSAETQLVYMFLDMVLSIDDFHNHVEVAIQTHGYDTWKGGESNLLVTMAMIGRLSNTSFMGFQYSVDNVVDRLTTTALQQYLVKEDVSLSLQFKGYRQVPQPARYSVDQHDREILGNDHLYKDEEHFIGICLQAPQTKHIPCDICFCKDCLNKVRILEEEPLNKARSDKPKRSRQRSWEKWSTISEPSWNWDYYVRYDAPRNTTPVEDIAAIGWGDEFSREEATTGKVTILKESEERSDWDDDEQSDFDDSSVYSISEEEGNTHQSISVMVQDTLIEEAASITRKESNESDTPKPEEEKDFSSNEVKHLKELLKEKTEQVQQMIRDQAKEYHENKTAMQKKEELWQLKESFLIKDLTDAHKIIEQLKTEQIRLEEQKDEEIRELKS